MNIRRLRLGIAAALVAVLIGGIALLFLPGTRGHRVDVVAYFDNSNGIYPGDEVRILGVPVGKIDEIEPEPTRSKISFWYYDKFQVPADAKAVIMSPSLVAVRAIQLTPAYTSGPAMSTGAVIPQERTAVPVEWDEFREQLKKLTGLLQPTKPGGVSSLGGFINTAANNLRGQGASIHETIVKLSQAFSALGDHSTDLFSSVKNLSILVSALQDSTDVLGQLNRNLATTTSLLSNGDNEVGKAVVDIDSAAGDVKQFVADNKEALGTTSKNLAETTTTLQESLDDLKQTLHVAPTTFQNFLNIYQPSQNALTGALAVNNFANPISFICGAVQAASKLGAEQAAKLCVQYLAPIVKNRQFNFPPLAENLIVGQTARPNEITYSEDWLRPDYVPPPDSPAEAVPALPAENPTDPAAGLAGMMAVPGGSGT